MAQHRNTVNLAIRLNDNPALQKCVEDKAYRIMIFCAGDSSGVQHISFPHQSELKVNGGDFKANLRGLKNKPGSTRPADITSALRLRSSYTNNVDFTYALTTKVSPCSYCTTMELTLGSTANRLAEILRRCVFMQGQLRRRSCINHRNPPQNPKGVSYRRE